MSVIKGRTSLTGGVTGALDATDGANLSNGDAAITFYDGRVFFHILDATSGKAESSPDVIAPDTNAGNKRWILVNVETAPGMINTNKMLYVATTGSDTTGDGSSDAPWATPHKAIEYLNDFFISPISTVTIQIADGVYNLASKGQLLCNHPCGSQINIIGATSSANNELQFDGASGILVSDGHNLGLINKLKITGSATGNGIIANNGSYIKLGSDVNVQDFSGGVGASYKSYVYAALVKVSGCSTGINSSRDSYIFAEGCDVDNCVTGVLASINSSVHIINGNIDHNGVGGNGTFGVRSDVNSFIIALSATIDASNHITTDTSPTKSNANDPTFGNAGSWIYG